MSRNVPASVTARLLNRARARNEEFERVLVRFAGERLLYRLGLSPHRDRFILKGAGLLAVWLDDSYRATRDIDMLAFGPNDTDSVRSLVGDVCAVPFPEDGLSFETETAKIEEIRAHEEYVGQRVRLIARLGRARIHVQIDVGFGDAIALPTEDIVYPTLLDGLPAPRIRGYPREASIAEKFHAMVSLGLQNSRMKDFHDIWALSGAFNFDGEKLRSTIAACFERRATPFGEEVPAALTPAFYQTPDLADRWQRYLRAGSVLVPPPSQFEIIGDRIIQFLAPVRASLATAQPFAKHWPPAGPWQ